MTDPSPLEGRRLCGWCRGAIEPTARADAVFCKTPCRQAAWRAKIGRLEQLATARPMRLAYADPPYPGTARRHYGDHPDYAGEVDHAELLSRLQSYDGWALSTSADALPGILAEAVAQGLAVRVAVWVHPSWPAASDGWEAVVYSCGRRLDGRPKGVLVGVASRRRTTLPGAVIGMKPPAFCEWVFGLLGALPGDTLDDLYPGSGMVARSWSWYMGLDPSRADPRDPSRAAAADGKAEGETGS